MGACDFYADSVGATPTEAFSKAVDRARYMNGHGGYTGTIAEKQDFVMLHLEAAARRLISLYEEELKTLTVAAQKNLSRQLEEAKALQDWDRVDVLSQQVVHPWKRRTMAEHLKSSRKTSRGVIAHLKQKGANRSKALVRGYARFCLEGYNDKWGPALCVPMTFRKRGPNTYVFFGMASS